MQAANAAVRYLMSDFPLLIVPAGTTNFNAGVGTGAFRLKSLSPAERYVGTRHANHGAVGPPSVEREADIG